MAATSETPVKVPSLEDFTGTDAKEAVITENKMRQYFSSQPKVSIKTQEDQWVQVNGYTFIIKGGERVEVPRDIANILEESGRI